MTDDLDMGAILNEYGFEETIRLAIGAGNDLAMICHRVAAIGEALGYLEKLPRRPARSRAGERRALQRESRRRRTNSPSRPSPRSTTRFGTCASPSWAKSAPRERSPEDGKRSPVESY